MFENSNDVYQRVSGGRQLVSRVVIRVWEKRDNFPVGKRLELSGLGLVYMKR